jgi:hypothetical protein
MTAALALTSRCPECNAPLEATVVRYLDRVVLDSEGRIASAAIWSGNDPGGFAWDHPAVAVYCANDHCIDWSPPAQTFRTY